MKGYGLIGLAVLLLLPDANAERARALGIPLEGSPGPLNAITDVAGVEVGHTTLIEGHGPLKVGEGPVRTGVTAILPRGRQDLRPVFAGYYSLNGVGEMTGTHFIEEEGYFGGPVMITNTHSVGVVRDAVSDWLYKRHGFPVSLPVVAETLDGSIGSWRGLNDANGQHVNPQHVFEALDNAAGGPVDEGNVGGGTGMICNGFKGGIGTASRITKAGDDRFTVGVLVQCNYGIRRWLKVAGVPVGREIEHQEICYEGKAPEASPVKPCAENSPGLTEDLGSIIVLVATDAPLLPHQLKRVARRVPLGLGRLGSASGDGSGDIFLAFSTTQMNDEQKTVSTVRTLSNAHINAVFEATVQATEEAVINSMLQAETMVGADGLRVPALPHDKLMTLLRAYNR